MLHVFKHELGWWRHGGNGSSNVSSAISLIKDHLFPDKVVNHNTFIRFLGPADQLVLYPSRWVSARVWCLPQSAAGCSTSHSLVPTDGRYLAASIHVVPVASIFAPMGVDFKSGGRVSYLAQYFSCQLKGAHRNSAFTRHQFTWQDRETLDLLQN